MQVLYTAAHSGFDLSRVPLGGGAAVCRHLTDVWRKTRPFDLHVLGPDVLDDHRDRHQNLVQMSEWAYARFCRAFEKKTTERILQHDPHQTIVLANDVSEGPDFRRVAQSGYPIFTIYHVDVVDYVTRMYLRSWVCPETVTHFYSALDRTPLRGLLPSILGLVVQKQQDSVLYSKGLIVPSAAMREVLLRCYPTVNPEKIHVLPWGIWSDPVNPDDTAREKVRLRDDCRISENTPVLLTLSRISPEKGQDRLLRALALWEKRSDFPSEGLVLLIAGEAAYMQGRRFEARLRQLAAGLKKTRVIFTGYAAGARKQALFDRADLYVFPSRHESYGLTLLEAMRAGLPALACDDHGTRDLMSPAVGIALPALPESQIPEHLMRSLRDLLSDRARLKSLGAAAQEFAARQNFTDTAARLAQLLMSSSPTVSGGG